MSCHFILFPHLRILVLISVKIIKLFYSQALYQYLDNFIASIPGRNLTGSYRTYRRDRERRANSYVAINIGIWGKFWHISCDDLKDDNDTSANCLMRRLATDSTRDMNLFAIGNWNMPRFRAWDNMNYNKKHQSQLVTGNFCPEFWLLRK